ncbi:hypothetical protein [Undibacterium sp.]|uniref:hypothetical protein n=1 Tax=Undibacterium sp. TaxID=1914977 RepID=UPI0037516AB0
MASHHDWVDSVIKKHDSEKPFAPENGRPLKFSIGDFVTYTNGYGCTFERRVTGFYQPETPSALYATGARYFLNNDCHWMPVSEVSLTLISHILESTK